MAWIVIDGEGDPVCDPDGEAILLASEAAAREWLMRDDQRVMRFDEWMKSLGEG